MANTLSKRLELVKNHFHLSNRRLAQVAGISGQGIADILNGVSKNPRNSIFVQISDQLDISLSWLLTGEGEMLKQVIVQEDAPGYNGFTRLPFSKMGISSASGSGESRAESPKKETYLVSSKIARIYKQPEVMQIRGDNMEPDLKHDDIVLITKIADTDWAMMPSGLYIVAYPPDHITTGRLIENTISENGKLILHSDNPKYGKISLMVEHLINVWQIRRLLDRDI
jgi:transcriptional regulator with XRE-family HTH domain